MTNKIYSKVLFENTVCRTWKDSPCRFLGDSLVTYFYLTPKCTLFPVVSFSTLPICSPHLPDHSCSNPHLPSVYSQNLYFSFPRRSRHVPQNHLCYLISDCSMVILSITVNIYLKVSRETITGDRGFQDSTRKLTESTNLGSQMLNPQSGSLHGSNIYVTVV